MNKTMNILVAVFMLLCVASRAQADEARKDVVSVGPRVGVFHPEGRYLDNTALLAGAQVDWKIDDTFGLRLGYEHTEAGVSDGSSLKLSRFPMFVTTPLRKRAPFKNTYMGFGGVATIAHYSDGHYPDVNKLGPALFLGWKFTKHFSTELAYNSMKRYGRSYGGYSLCITYDGF